jgi:hypothetical protein
MLLYIHHNGIHHNLVSDYFDWPYSSFYEYLTSPSLGASLTDGSASVRQLVKLAKEPVLSIFFNLGKEKTQQVFFEFHQTHKNGLGGYPNLQKLKDIAIDDGFQ